MHDVVIVGAGVAGSATAIHLARRGRSVLLLDRSSFPRRKACGEALFPQGRAELAALNVQTLLTGDSIELRAVRFTLGRRSAEARIGSQGPGAIGVSRLKLDSLLIDAARRAGAEIETGVPVRRLAREGRHYEVEADGERADGKVIVAADGLRSGLRLQAGLNVNSAARRYGISAHALVAEALPARIDVYFERGYEVYVTPLGGSLVNVAVLLDHSRVDELAGRLREGFVSLVRSAPIGGVGVELVDEPLAVGPFPAKAKTMWRANLVLAGDAAGFFDPISGNGMTLALVSARHCASAIDAYLSTGSTEPLREYERRCRALARNSTMFARLILALAARPRLGSHVLGNLARAPRTFSKLAAINDGELGFGALTPRDLLAFAFGV